MLSLTLINIYTDESSLGYRVGSEVIIAILVATTVGLFYELVARRSMTDETISVVKEQISESIASLGSGGKQDSSGFVGFSVSRQYVHSDIPQHLSKARTIKVMAIHGTRLWANRDFERAVLENAAVELKVLLLNPDSSFVLSRVEEQPAAYDQEVMSGEIRSCVQKLRKWQARKDGAIQLKLYDFPPSFWLVIVDSVLYLSSYDRGKVSQDSAVFKFDNREGSLFHIFSEHFDRIWAQAEDPEMPNAVAA